MILSISSLINFFPIDTSALSVLLVAILCLFYLSILCPLQKLSLFPGACTLLLLNLYLILFLMYNNCYTDHLIVLVNSCNTELTANNNLAVSVMFSNIFIRCSQCVWFYLHSFSALMMALPISSAIFGTIEFPNPLSLYTLPGIP